MNETPTLASLLALVCQCSAEDQKALLRELRKVHPIHPYEATVGAPAEMILEAIYRAPDFTRRMMKGVIADAAFGMFVVPALQVHGWNDVTPKGNHVYDYMLEDGQGRITVQVKLQRSADGTPVVKEGVEYGFEGQVHTVETQKTRTGTRRNTKTRPYRFGDFDILAVSMQPSTGHWDRFMYSVTRWLLQGEQAEELADIQPVAMTPNEFWTDDFLIAATWLRTPDDGKRLPVIAPTKPRRTSRKKKDNQTLDLF